MQKAITAEDRKRTLVLWSSGLDSTCALVNILENTKDLVYVHRIILENAEQRHKAESYAAERILSYLKYHYRRRRFVYTQSTFCKLGYVPYDMYIYMHVAGLIAQDHGKRGRPLDRVVTGSIKSFGDSSETRAVDGNLDKRRERAWKIFEATYYDNNYFDVKCEWHKPLINKTKEEVYNSLPKQLSKLCWSCRRPGYGSDETPVRCGVCSACMAMKRAKGEITPSQIDAYTNWDQ